MLFEGSGLPQWWGSCQAQKTVNEPDTLTRLWKRLGSGDSVWDSRTREMRR